MIISYDLWKWSYSVVEFWIEFSCNFHKKMKKMKIMKKIPNHVENFIIAFFYVLVIHQLTLKPKSVTKSALFLLIFSVLLWLSWPKLRLVCINCTFQKLFFVSISFSVSIYCEDFVQIRKRFHPNFRDEEGIMNCHPQSFWANYANIPMLWGTINWIQPPFYLIGFQNQWPLRHLLEKNSVCQSMQSSQ